MRGCECVRVGCAQWEGDRYSGADDECGSAEGECQSCCAPEKEITDTCIHNYVCTIFMCNILWNACINIS